MNTASVKPRDGLHLAPVLGMSPLPLELWDMYVRTIMPRSPTEEAEEMTTKSEGGVGEADRLHPEHKSKQKATKDPGITLLKNHVLGLRTLVLERLPYVQSSGFCSY